MGFGLDFDGILRIRLSQVKKKEITFVYSRRILIQAQKIAKQSTRDSRY